LLPNKPLSTIARLLTFNILGDLKNTILEFEHELDFFFTIYFIIWLKFHPLLHCELKLLLWDWQWKTALCKVVKHEKICFYNQHFSYNLHLIFLAS
jgi:hypothetical protein